jgi:hypothetical protein
LFIVSALPGVIENHHFQWKIEHDALAQRKQGKLENLATIPADSRTGAT